MHSKDPLTRRQFWMQAGGGAGGIALASLLTHDSRPGLQASHGGMPSPRSPGRIAKRVIWLFMHGGPSHVDLFDPKPALRRFAGKPLPASFGQVMTRRNVANNPLLGPIKPFQKRGECGLEISDFLPQIATHADELCVMRSLHGDSVNHPQSVYQMNTGSILMGKPSFGSWLAYGLGTDNQDMPAFVVLPDPGGGLKGGPPAWGNGFLPASYQGVTMRPGKTPILNLSPARPVQRTEQRRVLDLVQQMNRRYQERHDHHDELNARLASYELAFRMQVAAPEIVSLESESAETLKLYGIDRGETREFGTRCLLARRMIERGVRFVQLYSGDTHGWDAHQDVAKNHGQLCLATDRPIAGLLSDLKRLGLWDDTLIVWGGEFGRMPMSEQGKGRDHNPWGYSMWLAGGGVKPGVAYGATDEIGLRAVEKPVHVRDFHATLLHLLGIDHEALTFLHNGLEQRLTGPEEAHVVHDVIA